MNHHLSILILHIFRVDSNSIETHRDLDTTSSVLQLRVWGWRTCHNILYTPRQIRTFAGLRSSTIDFRSLKWRMHQSVFGIPSKYHEAYMAASEELNAWVVKCLMHQPCLGDIVQATIANTQRDIRNLVTLTEVGKEVKLATWERHTSPRKVTGSEEGPVSCEVSLFPLLTTFLGSMTLPVMMGKAFVAQSPTALEDIHVLDDGIALLALGLPRWLPITSLRNAYDARDRLHKSLAQLYSSLDMVAEGQDPGQPWTDLSDVSPFIKGYDRLWKKAGFSVPARAAATLSMPWA